MRLLHYCSVGVLFIAQDLMGAAGMLSVRARESTMMVLAAVTACAQVLLEPALFALAGMLPAGFWLFSFHTNATQLFFFPFCFAFAFLSVTALFSH